MNDIYWHLSPYSHITVEQNKIESDVFYKYITIEFNEIIDYDYNINNSFVDIKVNNIDVYVKFKCKIKDTDTNSELNLIIVSIDGKNSSYIEGKNCRACKKLNDFSKMSIFGKLIKYDKDKYDNKLNQIMPNILDCDGHYYVNKNIFEILKCNFQINITDILNKLNIISSQKSFMVRYNFG
jgi:hypothetical protein